MAPFLSSGPSRGTSMTVLIDSWVWIEYWKGGDLGEEAARYVEGDEEAIVSTINIAEVYFWVSRYYNQRTADEKLRTIEKRAHVIPLEKDVATEAARIRLKEKLALADSLVLATARSATAKVVTGDSDLKHIRDVIFLEKSDSRSST
ncbi:MAG: type II toxin-antitoxin system VapC family toxin [Thaumarchaeota archaeon]|nr:type II toxin-antitoxin system VapC family toxin [Nitrososphaerota archaeon]